RPKRAEDRITRGRPHRGFPRRGCGQDCVVLVEYFVDHMIVDLGGSSGLKVIDGGEFLAANEQVTELRAECVAALGEIMVEVVRHVGGHDNAVEVDGSVERS